VDGGESAARVYTARPWNLECEETAVPNEQPKIIEGELLARDLRFAFVAARFNDFVVDPLIRGAIDALKRHGASEKQIEIVRVPGAFDIPLVVRKLALSRRYDALVTLGAVVRGQTPHFDYVAGECASGIARIALESGVPIAFGVLTTDTMEQAVDRAGGKAGNKGADAALVAVEMANLLRRLDT
jgi:6,7-dimethyl-8-ribityllumazine synthase